MTEHDEDIHKALLYVTGLCARAEMCEQEIREKLRRRKLDTRDADRIVGYLTENNYVNEQRYASAYVRMKLRQGDWGPWKIRQGLMGKGLDTSVIRAAMAEVQADQYEENALAAARRKAARLDLDDVSDRQKLYRFLCSRGYESATIGRVMHTLGTEVAQADTDDPWEE